MATDYIQKHVFHNTTTHFHWGNPVASPGKMFLLRLIKRAYQCILSNQGKKLQPWGLRQSNKSVGNQNKIEYDEQIDIHWKQIDLHVRNKLTCSMSLRYQFPISTFCTLRKRRHSHQYSTHLHAICRHFS